MTPIYLFPPRTRKPLGLKCTNFAVLQIFGGNFVHNCTRHFRTLFLHFANCEMSILSNDALHFLLQCVCDDRRSPWSFRVMNICSPIHKHCSLFSDTGRVHNMFAIDCNKSSVNSPIQNQDSYTRQYSNVLVTLKIVLIWCRKEINTHIILMDTLPWLNGHIPHALTHTVGCLYSFCIPLLMMDTRRVRNM